MNYYSLVDPISNTPMIPAYNSVVSSASAFGKKRRARRIRRTTTRRRTSSKRKITSTSTLSDMKRLVISPLCRVLNIKMLKKSPKTLFRQIVNKAKPYSPRSPSQLRTVLNKICKNKSKVITVKHVNQTNVQIIKAIQKKLLKILRDNKEKKKPVTRKRRRRRRTTRSGFGTWWDNTQKTYNRTCASGQCADANTLGGRYPFYSGQDGTWKPYYPLR